LNGQILKNFTEHTNWVWQVIKLTDNIIATSSEDNTIKIWNIEFEKSIITIDTESPTLCLAFNIELRQLISGDLNGVITIRTLTEDFKVIGIQTIKAHQGIIRNIKIISDELIATCGEDNKVRIWNIANNICELTIEHQNFVQSLELIEDNILLSASYDGTIKTTDLKDTKKNYA
jgi:WD40 repeat protein